MLAFAHTVVKDRFKKFVVGAYPKPILKIGLNILFSLVFGFSLFSANFIVSDNFAHVYLEEISEDVYDVKAPFATELPNATTIGIFCALVLAVTTSNIGVVLQYVPNFATLSRAPPL